MDLIQVNIIGIFATFLSGLVIFFIYFYLYTEYREQYLLVWNLSWLFLLLRFSLELTQVFYFKGIPLLIIIEAFGLLNGYFLIWGTALFLGKKVSSFGNILIILITSYLLLASYFKFDYMITILPLFIVLFLLYAWTGIQLIISRSLQTLGKYITGITFILWGINNLNYPFLNQNELFSSWAYFLGSTFALAASFGILILFFQKNRVDLFNSRQLYKLFVEKSSEGIWRIQFDKPISINLTLEEQVKAILNTGYLAECNKVFSNLFGIETHAITTRMSVQEVFKNVTMQKLSEEFSYFINSGFRTDDIETIGVNRRGERRDLIKSSYGIIENDQLIAIWCTFRDATERNQLEENLLHAKMMAEKSDRLKSEFIAQISHEIRTPLNPILNFLSLYMLEKEDVIDPSTISMFDAIQKGSQRLLKTIDMILFMSELKAETYKPEFADIEISNVITSLIPKYQQEAQKKSLQFSFLNNTAGLKIRGDEFSISEIFSLLLDNAFKFTEQGEVNISTKNIDDNKLWIEISDTGIGISEEYMKDLYKPFTQEDSGLSRSYEGCGLGLALAKNYVELNNGEIKIESKKGTGTKIYLLFPLIK
ncbi:MAG: HAMP domain-containing sensor histidine kinase [bacterium]